MAAGSTPIYRVTVTARTAKAINYQHRSGATKIDFRGTELLPRPAAKPKSRASRATSKSKWNSMTCSRPTSSGAEYLTYVLWAITPEGRTANLGEILLNGTKSKLDVTTELQVFGLVVTAEPYYAVTRPSDVIVMENVVRTDTRARSRRSTPSTSCCSAASISAGESAGPETGSEDAAGLYEARNAVQIARSIGADRFAAETFQKAEKSLAQAEAYQARNAGQEACNYDGPRSRADRGRRPRHRRQASG